MRKDYIGTIDYKSSPAFQHYSKGICKCLKAEQHDISVVEVIKLHERVDMKHEKLQSLRAEQSRAESGLLALWTIGLTTLLNLLIEYMMKTASALRYLLAVEVEYSRR